MRIDAGQHMRLSQQMKLAPRMIQSMEILQMAQQALEERLEQELASNPTLEQIEPEADAATLRAEREQAERDSHEGERELKVDAEGAGTGESGADDFERLNNLAEEYGDTWEANTAGSATAESPRPLDEDFGGRSRPRQDGERDAKMDAMANAGARGASLYEQLIEQWHLTDAEGEDRLLGEFLIGFIDADGYLRTPLEQMLKQAPPFATAEELGAMIVVLQQSLEPPGLAARDLRECLLLQMDARRREDRRRLGETLTLERRLVAEFLREIEANHYPRIAKALDLPIPEIQKAVRNLRQFSPHPGRLLVEQDTHTLRPDAIIDYDEENDCYTAQLTYGNLPALTISRDYQQMARDRAVDKPTREFIGNQLRSASWLLDAIQQRNHTLLRVIGVVIEAQRDFFDQGPQALKPLPMTLVADQLGIHVATVSRAVSEKYLQTPRGIVPLRMFFSGGTETESGESMAWGAVQAKLEQVIAEEDKASPLSDDDLVEALKKHGIDIARRTVAKYRKQLNIPTARQRREYA